MDSLLLLCRDDAFLVCGSGMFVHSVRGCVRDCADCNCVGSAKSLHSVDWEYIQHFALSKRQMQIGSSSSAYAVFIYLSSVLSLLINVALLALYLRCPLKTMKTYKFFFVMMTIHDIAMSASMILCVPRGFGDVVLVLFWFALTSSMFILTNSFVYRYITICRPELSFLYTSRRWVAFIYALNALIFCNSGYLLVAISHSIRKLSAFMSIDSILVMLTLSISGLFCAIRIHLTLKHAGISPNVKRLQRQMFRVLLCQTVCPVMFLYFPSCAIYALLFGGFNTSPLFTDCLEFLTSMYPFFNPLVAMLSISDYRRYLLSLFMPSKSVPQVCSVTHTTRIVNVPERSAA
ncbi:unnamed protein product [Heligmosomoides polygyrus]|uniref:G_PROTEIN_RECEP_F1_2 domain-containing protein n=1 Tax=Heligmosomoides polygyrus TaxID=6339 RepID=A0A183G6A2_HELPZ|nr:unnamed protein product [Heligmosomoides polygyrus]